MKNSSVQGKEWVIKKYDKNLLELISSKYDLDFFTAKLLSIRGFKENEVESFLKPKIIDINNVASNNHFNVIGIVPTLRN